MEDKNKTKDQLIKELNELRSQVDHSFDYKSLRENEERLRRLSEAAKEGIVIHDRGKIIDANEVLAKMLGYNLSEIMGISIKKLVTPETWKVITKNIARGYIKPYEGIGRRKDESTFRVLIASRPYQYHDKSLRIAVVRDITEQKQVEEELAQEKRFSDTIIDTLPGSFFLLSKKGQIIRWNKRFEKNTRLSRHQIYGQQGLFFIHKDDRAKVIEKLKEVYEKGHAETDARTLIQGSHKWRDEILMGRKMKIGNEELIVGTSVDITERKKSESELFYEKEKAQRYLDIAGVILVALDSEGQITLINKKGCEILEYRERELVGKNWVDTCVPKKERKAVKKTFSKIISGEIDTLENYENCILTKSGKTPMIDWNNTILKDQNGKIIGTLSSGEDVTERKKTEETLKAKETLLTSILESTTDGILVVDDKGAVVYNNSQFEKLWHIPHQLTKTRDDRKLLEFVLDQLEYPKSFLSKVQALYQSTKEDFDTLRFKDGRIFERFSRPLISDGKIYGRVWSFRDITERKRVEESLVASEIRYRRLFEAAKDGILILDANTGTIVDVNPFLTKLLGFSHKEFCGKKIWEIGLFKDLGANEANFLELQKKGYLRYEDLPLETIDGQKINVEFVSNIYEVDHQKVIQCNIRDITKRKQIEDALRESEERLSSIFKNAADGLLIADAETKNFILCNQMICKMLGYNEKEIKKLNIADVHPSEEVPFILEQFKKLAAREISIAKDVRLKRKDETIFFADITAAPITLRGRTFLAGFFRDVSERKIADERLNIAYRQLENIIEFLPDATAIIDKDKHIIAWNRSMEEMTGVPKTDVIGKNHSYIAVPFYGHQRPFLMDLLIKKESKFETEYSYVKKKGDSLYAEAFTPALNDGKGAWVWAIASPLFDNEKNVIGIIESIRDITERKKAEEALSKQTEELKRSISELEQYAYVASHDLKEPLRMIVSYLQLIEKRGKEKFDDEDHKYFDRVIKNAVRMSTLIDDLLSYSFVGKGERQWKEVSCSDILNQATENLKYAIEDCQAVITSSTLPTVMGVKTELLQLFQNLISNAIKFRGDERLHIHVSAEKKGSHWIFSIQDNGIGIEAEFIDRIFNLFERLNDSDKYEGTGLGLAIVKKVVESYGGKLWVDSKPGQGSTFYFTLPASAKKS